MIEFTQDGPFAEKADQLFPDRVRIIGLGLTGASVCDQLILHGRPAQDIWVFDSDQQVIEGSIVPNRHLLGQELVHGLGCHGDLDLAREMVLLEENRLADAAYGCDFLILIVGLAGSTGVALAEHLTQLGRKSEAKVIVIGVQPFAFEGWIRREKSIAAIGEMRAEADSVLVISHDRLMEETAGPRNLRQSFHVMHQLLAQTAQALAQVVCKRGLIQLSFADVRSLFGRYSGSEVLENCWLSHVDGDIHDCPFELVEKLLAGPLLRDEGIWKHIDHAIVAVSGTRDLGLSDVQELVSALKDRLEINVPIATSASLDDDHHERVRMTVLFAMTAVLDAGEKKVQPVTAKPIADTVSLKPAPVKKQPVEEEPAPVATPPPARPARAPRPKPEPVLAVTKPAEEMAMPNLVLENESPVPVARRSSRRLEAKQEEMQFEGAPRGRFEKTHETIYRGENLDQPTFRRRRLTIRL